MANLTELSQWEAGIYQLETTDSVEAGAGGISNEQARLLGNRTKYLFDKLPKNTGWFSGLNIQTSTGPLSVFGDIVSAIATIGSGTEGAKESFITVTVANAMADMSYKVRTEVESMGSVGSDNDVLQPVFQKINETSFIISISEPNLAAGTTQNLKIHLEVVKI